MSCLTRPDHSERSCQDREVSHRRFVFYRPTDAQPLGIIHTMPKGIVNLRAQCKMHGSLCKCWLAPKPEDNKSHEQVLRDLTVWLGQADTSDEGSHMAMSVDIRKEYGVKIK